MKTEERLKRKKEKRESEREGEKCRFTLCIQETKVAVTSIGSKFMILKIIEPMKNLPSSLHQDYCSREIKLCSMLSLAF